MEKASFAIEHFKFDKVTIDLDNKNGKDIFVAFDPKGVFHKNNSSYELTIGFNAFDNKENKGQPFVFVRCIGIFKFQNVDNLSEIPSFFYKNSIAILFPYLRAYVSLVTNQANIPPLVLPTMNLSALEHPLKANSTEA